MTNVWKRLLGPAQFLTTEWGAVTATLTSPDGLTSATVSVAAWDPQDATSEGTLEDETAVKGLRVLVGDAAVLEDFGRLPQIEDMLEVEDVVYRVLSVSADPPGCDTMRELMLERIDRRAGFAEVSDRRRG